MALAQSGTAARIVTISTPGTPTGGVTAVTVAEETAFNIDVTVFNYDNPDARLQALSIRSRAGVAMLATEIQELPQPSALGDATLVSAATRDAAGVLTYPYGEDDAAETYYCRFAKLQGAAVAGADGATASPEILVVSDEPSLPGLPFNTTVDEIPVFITASSWRGEREFTAGGVKYLVIGVATLS